MLAGERMNQTINCVVSKTTINYALKRNIDFDISQPSCELDCDNSTILWFIEIEESGDAVCEPFLMYRVNGDGSFSYYSNIYLPAYIKEELPAHIENEKKLREVIDFLHREINKAK